MAYNFRRAERDQPFLLPPDLRDWLAEGHLAWFILDVVDQLDLTAFYRLHRRWQRHRAAPAGADAKMGKNRMHFDLRVLDLTPRLLACSLSVRAR